GLWFAGRPVTHDAATRGPGGLFGARGHRATPTGAYRTQVAGETGRPLLAVLLGRWPSREGSCRAHRARTLPFRASRASRASGASRDAFGHRRVHCRYGRADRRGLSSAAVTRAGAHEESER